MLIKFQDTRFAKPKTYRFWLRKFVDKTDSRRRLYLATWRYNGNFCQCEGHKKKDVVYQMHRNIHNCTKPATFQFKGKKGRLI